MEFDFGYDFRHTEKFFTDKNGDEREKVLEVKIDRNIDNKGTNSVEIQFQNDTIIERGNFYDEEIGTASIVSDLGIAYEKAIVVENNKGNRSFKIGKKGKKIFFIIGEFKDDEDEDKYDRVKLFKKNLKNFIEDKIIGNFNVFYYDECFRNSNRN